jgi:lipopolysaccharide transport system ATP-binding protein
MTVIEVKNLAKKYRIDHQVKKYVALRDVLVNVFKKQIKAVVRRKKENIYTQKKEDFWSLKDINFTVEKGEAVGIIGANGAGKSTLLKILSRITPPTEGEVIMRGRVSSLLEVGTGFHPELTGRENIYLNGAILGMTRKEIDKKFDDIVEFANVERFIDTPVKKYSSGMHVRLAFAVAAHLEPDILLIDEVLAVGDVEFQKKCLGKMDEVTRKAGRTVLFVSHNMNAIQNLCQRCILLDKGEIKMIGQAKEVVSYYLKEKLNNKAVMEVKTKEEYELQMQKIEIFDWEGKINNNLDIRNPFSIKIAYKVREEINNKSSLGVVFYDINTDVPLFCTYDLDSDYNLYTHRDQGQYEAEFKVPANIFNKEEVRAYIYVKIDKETEIVSYGENMFITFYDSGSIATKTRLGYRNGILLLNIPSETKKIN